MLSLTAPVLTALSAWFATIIGDLRGAVTARAGQDRALLVKFAERLDRLRQRFDALLARLAAGRYVPPAARPQPKDDAGKKRTVSARLPGGFVWVYRLLAYDAAAARLHLEQLLVDPAMVTLLAEIPAAGRLIRPMCRLLGIKPGGILVVATAAAPPAKPTPAAPMTWAELIASKPIPTLENEGRAARFQRKSWSQR